MNFEQAKILLEKHGQLHLLKFFPSLTPAEQQSLLSQVESIDFSIFDALESGSTMQKRGEFSPLGALEKEKIEQNRDRYEAVGLKALAEGKIAAVLLAGGQGTRLGLDKPKGMLNVGITKTLYLFEAHIRCLLKIKEKCGTFVPLYVMTSDINHDDTVNFFKENSYFGYDERYIKFFIQEMAPATDFDGRIYLKSKYELSLSPGGNGGWFLSMKKHGMVDDMKSRGVEYLGVFAVDNVLQKINDPAFVGATILSGVDVGAKVVRKNDEKEKVGVVCLEDGKPSIVEYFEITDEMASLKDENGHYAYDFGVILNYLFKLDRLIEITDKKLPIHIAKKKIPHIDESGTWVEPDEPNGYKYEALIIDMIHMLDTCLPYEVVREKEFAPIKNMHGVDSLDSARELMQLNGWTV